MTVPFVALVVSVYVTAVAVKFAVTDSLAIIVIVVGSAVPVIAPDQPLKV